MNMHEENKDSESEQIDDLYELILEELFDDSDVMVSLNTINIE